jgi:saccharopine dehydrogenase-like NADP-dependent oxidoreductase
MRAKRGFKVSVDSGKVSVDVLSIYYLSIDVIIKVKIKYACVLAYEQASHALSACMHAYVHMHQTSCMHMKYEWRNDIRASKEKLRCIFSLGDIFAGQKVQR